MAKRLLWLGVVSALWGCGGSGGEAGSEGVLPGTCRKAAIPSTGPGDALGYFPADVGRSWTYRLDTGETFTLAVIGTQTVNGETAMVFADLANPSLTELIVKRPAGVVVAAESPGDPIEQQLNPQLALPFPVVEGPTTELVRCVQLPLDDQDGDGKVDTLDLAASLTVLTTARTVVVPAGSFANVAVVRREVQWALTTSRMGPYQGTELREDSYAPGVGRVATQVQGTNGGLSWSGSLSLESWTVPTAPVAPKPVAASAASARVGSPSAAALGLTFRPAGLVR